VEKRRKDIEIDVFTSLPNRYQTYRIDSDEFENNTMIKVHRAPIPKHASGMLDQTLAFISYAKFVLKGAKDKEWDLIVATSSRLMTASLAAYLAKKKNIKLYLDIRDLFTDTMKDILRNHPLRIVLPFFRLMEKITYKSASRLNVVSEGFISHVKEIAPKHELTVFTNGIDDQFLNIKKSKKSDKNNLPIILYAGNIGEGQGLHNIIPFIAKDLITIAEFHIFGDGGRRTALETKVTNFGLENVLIKNPISRKELLKEYSKADILLIHLNNLSAFQKVLPSKIFEYAATEKPILAGVSGYAAEFIKKEVPGVEVFNPCDSSDMKLALKRLLAGPTIINRKEFCNKYLRRNIMSQMANDILILHEKT